MNAEIARRLEQLNLAFEGITGARFKHFYCAILFQDEPVELCRAHVVNQAFADSDRSWTIQRADVDSFFGSAIESDFVTLADRGQYSIAELITEPRLKRQLRPKIIIGGTVVPHYVPVGDIPAQHSLIAMETTAGDVHLALKMEPNALLASESSDWQIVIDKDLRIAAIAAALKSTHLTLFRLIGYRYALSAAGRFMGWDVLGSFYKQAAQTAREDLPRVAREHYTKYRNMVRPMVSVPSELKGTVSDKRLFVCKTAAWPWAMLVLVRTGSIMHAVLVPCFENEHAIAKYLAFLENPLSEIRAHLAIYSDENWKFDTRPRVLQWPEADLT